ncbi:MAG TPA: hypothetical protein PK402_03525, partial [Tepidisphaeraceae bacterium]|nr:hypothetical protein [Tepidisphaeraceae bacterium]
TRLRLPLTFLSALGLIAISTLQFGSNSIARAEDPPAPTLTSGGTIEIQEEIAPHFLRFGPSVKRGGETYGIYKFSPFRIASSNGNVSYFTELHLGFGGGAMASAALDDSSGVDATSRALLNGKLFTSTGAFTSVIRFVLTNEQLVAVDAFITEMENVTLAQPDPMVTYRFIDGRWGDLRIRKDTSGSLSMLVGKNDAGVDCWEAIDSSSFRAAIKLQQKRVERLAAKPVSATIVAN